MSESPSIQTLKRWEERKAAIMSRDFNHADTASAKTNRIERARKDYQFFVDTYFSHLAKCKCGKFQIDAAQHIKTNPNTRAVFEWARGHAKSSHVSLMIPLWLKIQKPRQINVMVLVSKSEDLAIQLLSDLQAELEFNELYKSDFGQQVKQGDWKEGKFKTADGCMFIAVGRGQTPRGIKNAGNRPDFIVIDDLDDDELIRNSKRVGLALDWCLSALIGAMTAGRGRFVMVGNRIGKDSVLSRMAERPKVYHTIVNAVDKRGVPSWKEHYSIDEFAKLREFMGERRFQKEYMNNPIAEGSVFLQKHIRYGKMLPLKDYGSLVCYTDPSFKSSTTADFKATMLVGKTKSGEFHVLKAFVEQTSVTDMVKWHYYIHDWIKGVVPVMYYMESNFIQDLILDEFRKTGADIGFQIPVRGDSRKKPDKFFRIEALQPLFERGLILLNVDEKNSTGIMQLEEQLLMFEKGSRTHDDAPDALEGAIFLLTKRITAATAYRCGGGVSRRY